ncbi:MAG TPA: zinc ribbon domain-containing protein [Gemmatimonadales bacterium]|nr:zinc ribbon domain-containing protein [Gemmatimonadales bacterium]
MVWEAIAAGLVGLAALVLVLEPLVRPAPLPPPPIEPEDPEETPKGVALAALREIEFDRATGKLSEADYRALLAKYTAQAVEALRAEERAGPDDAVEALVAARVRALRSGGSSGSGAAPSCVTCGPRPEPDALFCSGCGVLLAPGVSCRRCGAALVVGGKYCDRCGSAVAA